MAKFANIKLELQKITHFAHVQTLKRELKRLTDEIRKRGGSEVTQIEKNVRVVRARIQKLQKQIEKELIAIRQQLKKSRVAVVKTAGASKKSTKKAARSTTKKTSKKTSRKASV